MRQNLRRDNCYVGTERAEFNLQERGLFIEVGLFIVIGIGCIIFILKNPHFLAVWLESGKLKSILGVLFILMLSPFGAHLIAKILNYLWEWLIEISEAKRIKRSD
jgi:hypothetical protein